MNKIERKIIMLNDAQRLIILIEISKIQANLFPLTRRDFEDLVDEHLASQPTQKKGGK